MTESLPEVVVTVPCVKWSQHPVRLRIHDWQRWEVVENPCSALLGHAFALMLPCSAYVRERGDELRREVVKALSEAGTVAVPALVQALGDSSAAVRRLACYALGALGDATAVPALVEALGDGDRDVRRAACVALGRVGDATAVPALVEALGDGDSDVRRASCEALVRIRDAQAVPALIQALGDGDWYVRRVACEALGAIGDATAVPALVEALRDDDRDVRRVACEALGAIGDATAVPALVEALRDGARDVRRAACEALGAIGDATAVPALIKALGDDDKGDDDKDVRRLACGGIGDVIAEFKLIQTLGNDSVRSAAYEALVQIGSPSVPALVEALGDGDRDVRYAACGALGRLGDATAAPALRVHAECLDAARRALEQLGGTALPLADAVHQLLERSDWWGVLIKALPTQSVRDALVQIGQPAVPALVEALGDGDSGVRSASCEALGRIGDATAVPA